jgi:hypothetical protein
MRADQLHYTSALRGSSGNAGFQTLRSSPGIAPDEQREIERRGIYRPPRDARHDPDDETIARDFPRALRWYRLPGGSPALTRSSYVGRDYSGRWGNFFAHTLVFAAEPDPDFWPIDFYEWPGWVDRLAAEADDTTPAPLPVAELAGLRPAESFRLEELSGFLREAPGRRAALVRIGRALLAAGESSRPVVIRDSPLACLYWIACAQKLFPPVHARSLTISTYQDDPRGCATLNGTSGVTDFAFDEAERRFRFFVFDFTAGVESELPAGPGDYAERAGGWLAEDPARLARFFTFTRLFTHERLEPRLVLALELFELQEGREIGADRDFGELLGFAEEFLRAETRPILARALAARARVPGQPLAPADQGRLIRFLVGADGDAEAEKLATGCWQDLLGRVLATGGAGHEELDRSWRDLLERRPALAPDLARIWFDALGRGRAGEGLAGLPESALGVLLGFTLAGLEHLGRRPLAAQAELEWMVGALFSPASERVARAELVLRAVCADVPTLAALATRIAERGWLEAPRLGRLLGTLLATLPAESGRSVRRALAQVRAWDTLLGEWLAITEAGGDLAAAYERYGTEVMADLPEYAAERRSQIAAALLERLAPAVSFRIAEHWLESGEWEHFSPPLAATCVELAHRGLPLDLDDASGTVGAERLTRVARLLRLAVPLDRVFLREQLALARRSGTPLSAFRLAELARPLAQLPIPEFGPVTAALLPELLERVGASGDHSRVLQVFVRDDGIKPVEQALGAFLRRRRGNAWPEAMMACLRYWLGFDAKANRASLALAPLERGAFEGLADALVRLPERTHLTIRQQLKTARTSDRALERWQDLEARARRTPRGLWRRFTRLFRRAPRREGN